ncbi:MAG: [protein-PII] uridylyltransferase [Candidatus Hydrogenedentota bacterium]
MNASFTDLVAMAQVGDEAFRNVSREACLDATRVYMHERWSEIRTRHEQGESGINVVRQLAEAANTIVRGSVVFSLHFAGADRTLLTRMAVCALGGYGRGTLSPCSDLDVGILTDGRVTPDMKAFSRFFTPYLWDIGFHVGSTFHGVGEAVVLAKRDPQVFTTYVQARLIAGDNTVFARLKLRMAELRNKNAPVLEYVRRREEPGNLPEEHRDLYTPEPNVKEGVGGLRDYHVGMWMIALGRGVNSLDDLVGLGLISPEEHLELLEAVDFMLRVRTELHFATGRDQNVLTYDLQKHVAEAFDYGNDSVRALDRFLKDYYVAARNLRRFLGVAARIADNQLELEFTQAPAPDDNPIVVRDGRLYAGAGDPNWFIEHPSRLMRVFYESVRHDVPLSLQTERQVTRSVKQVGDALVSNDLVRRFFVAICNHPMQAGRVLRQMADCGLLAAYIPEFAEVQSVVRYEDFHHYPVDEHTLRAIEALAAIPHMEGSVARVLERVLQHISDHHILVMAVLFHDLGKVSGDTHVAEGVRLARRISERIGLDADENERIAFLVEHHLLMNTIAMYRDTDDWDTIRTFAQTMKSDERLGKLLLLSYADLCAVGPGVWTEWKGALLLKLFLKTERYLRGRTEVSAENYWSADKIADVRKRVPEHLRLEIESHVRGLGTRYLVAFSAAHIAWHLTCLDEARRTGLAVYAETHEETGTTEVVVCTQDRPGLFSRITGSFTAQLADVRAAALFTRPDGFVVDCFTVIDASRHAPLTEAQLAGMRRVLRGVLMAGEDVQRHVDNSRRRIFALLQPRTPVQTRIEFDNEASRTHTVIDVETGDRTGLLYDITRALTQSGLDIQSARIVTDARRIRDAFYVQMDGTKLEDKAVQELVRAALFAAVEPSALSEAKGGM